MTTGYVLRFADTFLDNLIKTLDIRTFGKGGIKFGFRSEFSLLNGWGCGQMLSE